jgi:hypothetical protein
VHSTKCNQLYKQLVQQTKAQKWKQEIETKKIEINKKNKSAPLRKPLLTKGLIGKIKLSFLENGCWIFQQKIANGDSNDAKNPFWLNQFRISIRSRHSRNRHCFR